MAKRRTNEAGTRGYNTDGDLDLKCNLDSVDLAAIPPGSDEEVELRALLDEHVRHTGSPLAERLLGDWPNVRPHFVRICPVR